MGVFLWLRRGKKNSFPMSLWKHTYRLLFLIVWTVKTSNESHTTYLWFLLPQQPICLLRYILSNTEYSEENGRVGSGAQACIPPYGFSWPTVHWWSITTFVFPLGEDVHGIHSELLRLSRPATNICRKLYIFLKKPSLPAMKYIYLITKIAFCIQPYTHTPV